jgi:hypothetical protein
MRYDYTYEIHKTVEAQRFRHRERDHSHLRALKGDDRLAGIVSRIMGGLGRLRSADSRRWDHIARDAHTLTDKVCRLADGSLGRVAVREEDGELTEICVPA